MRREEERTGLSKFPGSRRKIVLNSRAHPNAIAGTVVSTSGEVERVSGHRRTSGNVEREFAVLGFGAHQFI